MNITHCKPIGPHRRRSIARQGHVYLNGTRYLSLGHDTGCGRAICHIEHDEHDEDTADCLRHEAHAPRSRDWDCEVNYIPESCSRATRLREQEELPADLSSWSGSGRW